jgi:hypothetical protein
VGQTGKRTLSHVRPSVVHRMSAAMIKKGIGPEWGLLASRRCFSMHVRIISKCVLKRTLHWKGICVKVNILLYHFFFFFFFFFFFVLGLLSERAVPYVRHYIFVHYSRVVHVRLLSYT